MPQTALDPLFLFTFNVDSELWDEDMLGSPVSARILEAMNLILRKDGILAFIGTRDAFGDYLQKRTNETGKDNTCCWTSMSSLTVRGLLGLCRHTGMSGRPEVVCYGSPLTVTLAEVIRQRSDLLPSESAREAFQNCGTVLSQTQVLMDPRKHDLDGDRIYSIFEFTEAWSYLD